MFTFTKGENIPLILQLIKSDGTIVQTSGLVTYKIYSADGSTIIVTQKIALWNSIMQGYFDNLEVSTNWENQREGNYILIWSITDTLGFPNTIVDNIQITPGGIEGSLTVTEFANIIFAILAGKSNVIGNTIKFRNYIDTKDRITAITDNKGNRLSITIDCDD